VLDLATETPLPLTAAAKLVPPGRNGKRTHLSTLLRWILQGAKRPDGEVVRLEAVRLGARWFTSREALQRFAEGLTPNLDRPAPAPRSPGMRERAAARAGRALDRLGI
jgi:hypothetical protein